MLIDWLYGWIACQLETEAVYRSIMLASQANSPVYVTKVMSRSSADVVADSRRTGNLNVNRFGLLLLVWHAPLGVRSAKRRHQSPEWTILSHSYRLVQGEIGLVYENS